MIINNLFFIIKNIKGKGQKIRQLFEDRKKKYHLLGGYLVSLY